MAPQGSTTKKSTGPIVFPISAGLCRRGCCRSARKECAACLEPKHHGDWCPLPASRRHNQLGAVSAIRNPQGCTETNQNKIPQKNPRATGKPPSQINYQLYSSCGNDLARLHPTGRATGTAPTNRNRASQFHVRRNTLASQRGLLRSAIQQNERHRMREYRRRGRASNGRCGVPDDQRASARGGPEVCESSILVYWARAHIGAGRLFVLSMRLSELEGSGQWCTVCVRVVD